MTVVLILTPSGLAEVREPCPCECHVVQFEERTCGFCNGSGSRLVSSVVLGPQNYTLMVPCPRQRCVRGTIFGFTEVGAAASRPCPDCTDGAMPATPPWSGSVEVKALQSGDGTRQTEGAFTGRLVSIASAEAHLVAWKQVDGVCGMARVMKQPRVGHFDGGLCLPPDIFDALEPGSDVLLLNEIRAVDGVHTACPRCGGWESISCGCGEAS